MSFHAMAWAMNVTGISSAQKFTLVALANMASPITDVCWPSIAKLAADTVLSERTIQTCLSALETAGLLTVKREHRKPNHYTLPVAPEFKKRTKDNQSDSTQEVAQPAVTEMVSEVSAPQEFLGGNVVQLRAQPLPSNLSSKLPSQDSPPNIPPQPASSLFEAMGMEAPEQSKVGPSQAAIAEGFKRFWKAYPRKSGRGEAERNFTLAVTGKLPVKGAKSGTKHPAAAMEDLIRAAETFGIQCKADSTIPVKWGQGWISERRWLDYENGARPDLRRGGGKPSKLAWMKDHPIFRDEAQSPSAERWDGPEIDGGLDWCEIATGD